jgi:predicted ATPase/class 3 adenylate cyclase
VSELPTGTVTLLFTDIEGSTRLLERLASGYEDVLSEHRCLVRQAVVAHSGVEVDTQGDAFLCAFARGSDAVEAAAEAQRLLAATPVRVRMGVHTGEPTRTAEGYVGVDLHRGARVMAAAHGGQVLLSEATRSLLGDVAVRDLGEHRLKDLSQPQRLYQLLAAGLEADFPPPRTLENRPTNLPVQATPLVGRQRELQEVVELLSRPEVRLVTLSGPGGSGKTRLGLQAGAELVEEYPQGVWFVNLAALRDPELVMPAVAQTLGVKEQPGETIVQTLAGSLREQTLLLLLDNFEQVLEAAPALAELLGQAPKLDAIATSRSSLRLQAEHEYVVPALGDGEALALFVERAQAVKGSFGLNGNRQVVAEICRRLDKLPLAIELAAARIKLLPEQALLERLDAKLKVLTGGARDLDERQRTLRATIDWSYQLLSEEEQLLFRRLAVFAGGRTFEAIEMVCAPDGELDVFAGVASLVDKSLLRREETEETEPRFVMLETIHEYAREKLTESGEADDLRRRHADYFVTFARQANTGGDWKARSHWLPRLAADFENLQVALECLRATGRKDDALQLLTDLDYLLWAQGRYRLAANWAETVLAESADQPAGLRSVVGGILAGALIRLGEHERAIQAARHCLELAREDGHPQRILGALRNAGNAHQARHDLERARPIYEEMLTFARHLGDERETANAVLQLSDLALSAGSWQEAEQLAQEALDILDRLGDEYQAAPASFNLAVAKIHLGQTDEASQLVGQTVRQCRRLLIREGLVFSLLALGAIGHSAGRSTDAAAVLGAADALATELELAISGAEGALRDDTNAAIRRALGDKRFGTAYQRGRSLSTDDALELGFSLAGGTR